ncbi:Rab-GAP TBC domain-containing protein [Psidium guajava]|nr:Rab-GAP TBC domain-containing protein [Psidium guajava]
MEQSTYRTRRRRRYHLHRAERWWCSRRTDAISAFIRQSASRSRFHHAAFWSEASAPAEARDRAVEASERPNGGGLAEGDAATEGVEEDDASSWTEEEV